MNKWLSRVQGLSSLSIPRCCLPEKSEIEKLTWKNCHCSLHHFSDASKRAYGQVIYLRLVDNRGKIRCTSLTGKPRIAPIRYVSIQRFKLTAA